MKRILFFLGIYCSSFACMAQTTNQDILAMKAKGFSDTLLIRYIRIMPGEYNISASALMAMKDEGIGDAVISAIIMEAAPVIAPQKAAQQRRNSDIIEHARYQKETTNR